MFVSKLLLLLAVVAAFMQVDSEVVPLASLHEQFKGEALTASLKQAEINLAPSLLQTSRMRARMAVDKQEIPLSDVVIQVNDGTTIELTNVRLSGVQIQGLNTVIPDLTYLNMHVALPMGTLQIVGDYSVVSENVLDIIPLTSEGELSIVLSDMLGEGLVGMTLGDEFFHAINFDMKYTPSNVIVTAVRVTDDGPEVSQLAKNAAGNQLVKKLWRELQYHLNIVLQEELDNLLQSAPAKKLLESDMLVEYREYARALSAVANRYIDELLARVDKYIADNNVEQIEAPSFSAGFSKKILWVTWHGSFSTNNGYARSLATIKRRSDATLSYENGKLVLVSSLGLDELKAGYNYWRAEFMNVGPKGALAATPGYNSVFLKASLTIGLKPTAAVEELYVEHLDNINVSITGLGILNWLASKVVTWVIASFNDKIVAVINSFISSNMDQIISGLNPNDYFM